MENNTSNTVVLTLIGGEELPVSGATVRALMSNPTVRTSLADFKEGPRPFLGSPTLVSVDEPKRSGVVVWTLKRLTGAVNGLAQVIRGGSRG
jgi:hypothetical protein